MKTTLELPETLFRRAKARASQEGLSFKQFVTEAIRTKLNGSARAGSEPRWRKHFGAMRAYRDEIKLINQKIHEACEQIDQEDWK